MAEHEMQPSLLMWYTHSLGIWALILPLAGLICFGLTLFLVIRGRGPMAAAALVLVVNGPLLLGILSALQGATSAFSVIAYASSAPKPSELAAGISTALVGPLVSLLIMAPSYAVAVIGATVRSLSSAESGK